MTLWHLDLQTAPLDCGTLSDFVCKSLRINTLSLQSHFVYLSWQSIFPLWHCVHNYQHRRGRGCKRVDLQTKWSCLNVIKGHTQSVTSLVGRLYWLWILHVRWYAVLCLIGGAASQFIGFWRLWRKDSTQPVRSNLSKLKIHSGLQWLGMQRCSEATSIVPHLIYLCDSVHACMCPGHD